MTSDRVRAFVELVLTADERDVERGILLFSPDEEVRGLLRQLSATTRVFLQTTLRHIPEESLEGARNAIVKSLKTDVQGMGVARLSSRPPYPSNPEGYLASVQLLEMIG